ncbi:MAG: L,D-transpeptidase family protein [Sphingomonadales bacterium]|nr:L,D-transpeptidase family protein [Sphingomonadales bacterium]
MAILVVIGLLVWGAFATGIVNLAPGDEGPVAQSPPDPFGAEAQEAATRPLPQPDFASDDETILRPENEEETRPVMQRQVVLDRLGFSPGVIDGRRGRSFANAVRGFQRANDLEPTGEIDAETEEALAEWDRIPSTREIVLTQKYVDAELTEEIPEDPEERAELDRLGYTSLEEKLAERFHTTPAVLRELNPDGLTLEADSGIVVPNIGKDRIVRRADRIEEVGWLETLAMLGVSNDQPQADRIVVDESEGVLMVYADDRLIAQFPATMGSERDPLPLGEWDILGVSYNPNFQYNPELFWDVEDSEESVSMPPGPNSPVGVVWIDLSKEHYGIHGTAEPQTIGRAQSHGCIRLTNWDAARLAQMVSPGIKAVFRA